MLCAPPQIGRGDADWHFLEVTRDSGLATALEPDSGPTSLTQRAAGGVAAGDVDRDGDIDLYVLGPGANDALFVNQGDGTFEDRTRSAGLVRDASDASGPLFFDFDGDGWLDLFVGGTDGDAPALYRNRGDGRFVDVTHAVGLAELTDAVSASAGDFDGDGYLDLFVSHWSALEASCHLWRNLAGVGFACADARAGLEVLGEGATDDTFTANFVDYDGDARIDLLVTADFGHSAVFRNVGDGRFERWDSSEVISDENGMGAALGDYDGDGDLDWFVTSIWDDDGVTEGDWGTSGNRLYRNRGDGSFEDATDEAGVREGDWGWAACFADLDQDTVLDLVHVNGWPQGSAQFRDTPTRLFVGASGGHFEERSAELGLVDTGDGRGLVCFDYDADGDLDLFVANRGGSRSLWRNEGGADQGHYVHVRLRGPAPNRDGVGAVVHVTAGGKTQVRLIRAGSNYVSQDPAEAHFGLGSATRIDAIRVVWPDGVETLQEDLAVDREVVVQRRRASPGGC